MGGAAHTMARCLGNPTQQNIAQNLTTPLPGLYYWSSTEYSQVAAWVQLGGAGGGNGQGFDDKGLPFHVRCARAN